MRITPAAAVLILAVLTGCGESDADASSDASESPTQPTSPSPAATETSAALPTTVEVAVLSTNVLNQSCEALSGIKKGLHTGATVTLEDASGADVSQGRLGKPPVKPTGGICAWGATMEADLNDDEMYTAVVADRFTSKPMVGWKLATEYLIIDAK